MKVDIIILSFAKTPRHRKLTESAIASCLNSEDIIKFNIVVVETNKDTPKYENAKTIYFEGPFNYNKALNIGIKSTKNTFIALCNNDLEFKKGWATTLITAMGDKYLSASPFSKINSHKHQYHIENKIVEGYKIGHELLGWCLFCKRELFEIIGDISEGVEFWYSDNIYADQLKMHNIKHILVCNSVVNHLGWENTVKTLTHKEQSKLKYEQKNKYTEALKRLKYKYRFTVVIPSYCGKYNNSATNKPEKLKRAVMSVLKQTFKDFEIIIIADGCNDTVKIYKKFFNNHERVSCFSVNKQAMFSGRIRNVGLDNAEGEYIVYLDNDDVYAPNHLETINNQLQDNDFVYFNDIVNIDEGKVRNSEIAWSKIGTSNICHKKDLKCRWDEKGYYGHDFIFIQNLLKEAKKKTKIEGNGYVVCHIPEILDV